MPLVIERPLRSWNYFEQLTGIPKKEFLALSEIAGSLYRPFDLRRRGTEKWRHIDNPEVTLKSAQRALQRGVFRRLELPETITGGVVGRGTLDAARAHVGQSELVTLDLRDCFPRTSNVVVYNALCEHLLCKPEIAAAITRLVTFHRLLPQGAPTSPALANLTLLHLHAEIAEICDNQGLSFSFYVDDIAFSGDDATSAIEPIIRAIQRHGHAVRCKKKHVLRSGSNQAVTGITTNNVLSAGRKLIEQLREEIFELAATPDVHEAALLSLKGKIVNVSRINASQGATLSRLAERLLPPHGVAAKMEPKDEYRACPPCVAVVRRKQRGPSHKDSRSPRRPMEHSAKF